MAFGYRKNEVPGGSGAHARARFFLTLARSAGIPCFVLVFTLASSAYGVETGMVPSRKEAEAELNIVQRMIRTLSSRLGSARSKQEVAEEKLRAAEIAMDRLAREFREIESQLNAQKKQLGALRAERDEKTMALDMQRESLARQIRFAYATGRQDYLKIFLNQEDPSKVARVLTYYRYFNLARAEQIEETERHLQRIDALEVEINRKTASLNRLKQAKEQNRRELEKVADQRREALAKIAREISRDDQKLARLKQNKARLEKLIAEIRQSIRSYGYHKPFRQLKGHLKWPVVGVIMNDFGSRRDVGDVRWQGVNIAANEGRPVRAIAHGQVVFADWLRGFGLFMILDHGDGYMSLYGHNQSLNKGEGDRVGPGDIIASVGKSGGNADDSLYFEIRHQGEPQNPALWCK